MCVHLFVFCFISICVRREGLAPMETNTLHHTLYEGVHYWPKKIFYWLWKGRNRQKGLTEGCSTLGMAKMLGSDPRNIWLQTGSQKVHDVENKLAAKDLGGIQPEASRNPLSCRAVVSQHSKGVLAKGTAVGPQNHKLPNNCACVGSSGQWLSTSAFSSFYVLIIVVTINSLKFFVLFEPVKSHFRTNSPGWWKQKCKNLCPSFSSELLSISCAFIGFTVLSW